MHEVGVALEIAEIAAARSGDAEVRRVRVAIGRLALVLPDALRFAWEVVTADTRMAGATLDIVEVPGRARCRDCACEMEISRPVARCACGSIALDWLAGEELKVLDLEVT
jgi:hydrogenase nickel incorporation protein HypA/HybF